ncbi:MAG: glycosyltransferase family 1 protein [Chitinophagaceae bacterium]|nr:MAG: glycosyltransferase family 1 protein [Chitinophagaceae bacterium]
MNIGYDGKRAAKNLTGLGNYSRWLVGEMAKAYPEHDYLVYAASVKDSPRIKKFLEIPKVFLRPPFTRNFLWRSIGILKDLVRDKVSVYHGLSHELPLAIHHTNIRSVVTMHDLIFLRYPQHYKYFDRLIYSWKSRNACKHADKIIAISEKTKEDIIEFFHVNPAKIEVIYQSCDDSFKTLLGPAEKKYVRDKYNLPGKYVLYVGTIESRKNLVALVKAFDAMDKEVNMVVVGRKTKYYGIVEKEINDRNLKSRIRIMENLDFADLPAIYQNAALFVLPSYYEGFGIPVIEALYSGIPVIAATGSCMEEAGGPDSIYIDPDDTNGLAHAMKRVMSDTGLRKEMIEKGLNYVKKFETQALCDKLMSTYRNLLP